MARSMLYICVLVSLMLGITGCLSAESGKGYSDESSPGEIYPEEDPALGDRKIDFAGYSWHVKEALYPAGPGPNYFSASRRNVYVDDEGALHLHIIHRRERPYCSEVVTEEAFGYGSYLFYLEGAVDAIDPQEVLGLFTWDTAPAENNREIDIEFSRWGVSERRENGQYVVQPFSEERMYAFEFELSGDNSTHLLRWLPGRVDFASCHGHVEPSAIIGGQVPLIESWSYEGGTGSGPVPTAGDARVRINLYLYEGKPTPDREDQEIVIRDFLFIPEGEE
ncbi:MAG: serine protease [Spirochaetia bacterium]